MSNKLNSFHYSYLSDLDNKYHGVSFIDMITEYNKLNRERLRYYDKKSKRYGKRDARFTTIKEERSYIVKRVNFIIKKLGLSLVYDNGKIIGLKQGPGAFSPMIGSSGFDYYPDMRSKVTPLH